MSAKTPKDHPMSMTPEERALAVLGARLLAMPNTRDALQRLIAQAIRRAENDKLEEAAEPFETRSGTGLPLIKDSEIAALIRSYKNKD